MLKEYHRPSVLAGLGLRTNNVLLHKPQAPGEAGSSNGTGCLSMTRLHGYHAFSHERKAH